MKWPQYGGCESSSNIKCFICFVLAILEIFNMDRNKVRKLHCLKQHFKNFDCLRQHNLKLKLLKCKLMQKETQYLGFIFSEDGITADPEKGKGNETDAMCKIGKMFQWYVQLLQEVYFKLVSNCKTSH